MSHENSAQALGILSDPKNHPILVHCANGKASVARPRLRVSLWLAHATACDDAQRRSGCIVACLRKLVHEWSLTATLDEYSRFVGPGRPYTLDWQFIEAFQCEAIR